MAKNWANKWINLFIENIFEAKTKKILLSEIS